MAIHPASTSSEGEKSHSLSFPAAHYAKLFPRDFLQAHLPAARPSGRQPHAPRRPTVHAGSLAHAHGSAVVRLGDTAAVCGVRGEILHARDVGTFSPRTRAWLDRAAAAAAAAAATARRSDHHENDDNDDENDDADPLTELGLLVPNIELSTGCHPQHLPGSPPSATAQSLTQRVLTLLRLTRLLSLRQLIIWSDEPSAEEPPPDADAMETGLRDEAASTGDATPAARKPMAFWTLYIDILLISLDGSAISAAWLAALAALLTTSLPEARWDADRASVLCHPDFSRAQRLVVNGLPMPLDFAIFEPWSDPASARPDALGTQVLVDPDDLEESCCPEEVTVVVDEAGKKVWRIEKSGGGAVGPAMMRGLVEIAGQQWVQWQKVMEEAQILQATKDR